MYVARGRNTTATHIIKEDLCCSSLPGNAVWERKVVTVLCGESACNNLQRLCVIGPWELPVLWFKARRVGPAYRGCSWLDGLGCRSLSARNVVWSSGKLLRLGGAYKNVAVREGSAREFENSFRKRSAYNFPVLNGSVLTGHILS